MDVLRVEVRTYAVTRGEPVHRGTNCDHFPCGVGSGYDVWCDALVRVSQRIVHMHKSVGYRKVSENIVRERNSGMTTHPAAYFPFATTKSLYYSDTA